MLYPSVGMFRISKRLTWFGREEYGSHTPPAGKTLLWVEPEESAEVGEGALMVGEGALMIGEGVAGGGVVGGLVTRRVEASVQKGVPVGVEAHDPEQQV
jgi:hypothetical protein